VVMVDNCYGEFCERHEPTYYGADLMAGSLIKNPGGGLAPTGAYLAGTMRAIERIEAAEKDIAQNRTEVTEAKQQISTFNTSIMNDCRNIIFTALEDYVETSDFEKFQHTCESAFNQTAKDINIGFQEIKDNGVDKVITATGFTFDGEGLTVSKNNSEMSTQISEDGMTVFKNAEEVLIADNQGVKALNLHATTYLIVGNNSRFEDYGNRTGCFWIGG